MSEQIADKDGSRDTADDAVSGEVSAQELSAWDGHAADARAIVRRPRPRQSRPNPVHTARF